jgi:hypothetical protein
MARRKNDFVVLKNEGGSLSVWRGGFTSTRQALRKIKEHDDAPLHGVVANICAGYTKEIKQVSQATITLGDLDKPGEDWPRKGD